MGITGVDTRLNMVAILKESLEREIKEIVTERLIKELLEDFEVKARKEIKPLVDRISLKGIDSVKNMLHVREELHVFMHWDDD